MRAQMKELRHALQFSMELSRGANDVASGLEAVRESVGAFEFPILLKAVQNLI